MTLAALARNAHLNTEMSSSSDEDLALQQTGATFADIVATARDYSRQKKVRHALVYAQIAAHYASYNHGGIFFSPELEDLVLEIGRKEIAAAANQEPIDRQTPSDAGPARVLHVLTSAKDVGGDTRFVWRWISRDSGRAHSVALTTQMNFQITADLAEAVNRAGGAVHALDAAGADVIQRAAALRAVAANVDVVFLHVYPEDIVPLLAFADNTDLPPVVFVVQADHQFWMGLSVSDLVVHLRQSGAELSAVRRGVQQQKMAMLAIPLEPVHRQLSRAQAKQQLQLADDSVVLLSIAREVKYQPVREPSFADALLPLLERHKNLIVLVVGPRQQGRWQHAYEKSQGRIRALGQRSDTSVFYQAADLYLDSFPFASNTSLLEAGSFGLPLVSYFPYQLGSVVLGAGAPGLDRTLLRVTAIDDLQQALSRLIEDQRYRQQLGESTKDAIAGAHSGDGWKHCLKKLYDDIAAAPDGPTFTETPSQHTPQELDRVLNQFYSGHVPLGWMINWYLRGQPYWTRLALLKRAIKLDRSFSFSLFLPGRTGEYLARYLRGWRKLPGLSYWLSAKQ